MVSRSVPVVRWFLEIHPAFGRINRDLQGTPIAPGRPLMARGAQTDSLHGVELFQILIPHWKGINKDGAALLSDCVAIALVINAIVFHGKAIDSG